MERSKLTDPYGYIFKPFELNRLMDTVEIALHKQANHMKKEKTISLLKDSVAEVLWDTTSIMSSKPMKVGWLI